MTALNGKSLSAPPDPTRIVAEAVYIAMMDESDPPFADLDTEDLADILVLTENYLQAHLSFLKLHGYRLLPPGVTPLPTCVEEALAMVQAAQRFTDSKRGGGRQRKSRLVGSVVPKKLILPPGGSPQ